MGDACSRTRALHRSAALAKMGVAVLELTIGALKIETRTREPRSSRIRCLLSPVITPCVLLHVWLHCYRVLLEIPGAQCSAWIAGLKVDAWCKRLKETQPSKSVVFKFCFKYTPGGSM